MFRLFLIFIVVLVSSCSVLPKNKQFSGGKTISDARVDFTLPEGQSWSYVGRGGYPIVFLRKGELDGETYVASVTRFEIPDDVSANKFPDFVKRERSEDLDEERYELLSNHEFLSDNRSEVCVVHRSKSIDNQASRGKNKIIFETFGMNCIDPLDKRGGVFIELSRKAQLSSVSEVYESQASDMLDSVKFRGTDDPGYKVYYSRVLVEQGKFDSAEELANEVLDVSEPSNNYDLSADAYVSLGVNYTFRNTGSKVEESSDVIFDESLTSEAVLNYNKAIDSYEKSGNYWGVSNALVGLGDLFAIQGYAEKSCDFYSQSLDNFNGHNVDESSGKYTWGTEYSSYSDMLNSLVKNSCK